MEREQIIGVLRQPEAEAECYPIWHARSPCRATIYIWKSKYGWMGVYEAQRLKSP